MEKQKIDVVTHTAAAEPAPLKTEGVTDEERCKDLLCEPMREVAEITGDSKEAYRKQMEIMAEWMQAQPAFQQLMRQMNPSEDGKE